ncbi:MAG: hypothetical protein MUC92_14010 [Fimbriimonadaceae bacterium]|nr:hypothetical protein [Fimbriimonadaceae bacterium]
MSFRINTNVTAMTALRNLLNTGGEFSKSVNRLSTGSRINSAADDPAGLIFSEGFRAQIGGVDAAVRNNQDAINFAKTAEGALDEISRLLREGRSLAVASANTAVLSADQLQANQTQLNLILSSINRIADTTAFGTRKLLNGSSGVNASVVNATQIDKATFGGTFGGTSVTASGTVAVNVTTAATRATHTGSRTVTAASLAAYQAAAVGAAAGTFSINGQSISVAATDTWGDVVNKINTMANVTGVTAQAVYGGGNGQIALTASSYGTKGNFILADAGVLSSSAGATTATGVNAVATVTFGAQSATFTGGLMGNDGLTMTDNDGNRIVLNSGVGTGNVATALHVNVGSAQFQTGGNSGQRSALSIGNFSTGALDLLNLDITNSGGAATTLDKIDSAINELNRKRGEIGSFMRNVLESNVRTLNIARENLSATESQVRDIDVAQEMTNYTKLQILQQSGLSVLAQANQAPQAVLNLLRG